MLQNKIIKVKSEKMKKIVLLLTMFAASFSLSAKGNKTVELKFVETSDVHGMFFPKNYLSKEDAHGSMARVSSYVRAERKKYGNRLILLDNGDILQGQPTNYLWNYLRTNEINIAASIINYLKYDAETFGNHDIEASYKVYDKWISDLKCPVLGANVISDATGKPYTSPYIMIERDGVRIAVIGMLTSAIPSWLSHDIWQGIHFDEMVSSAKKWVDIVKKTENPDIIVGVFHSGLEGGIVTDEYKENVTKIVAEQVPGFDFIFYGHDHNAYKSTITNSDGKIVHIANPGNDAKNVAEITVKVSMSGKKVVGKHIETKLVDMADYEIDSDFMEHFSSEVATLNSYIDEKIAEFDSDMYMYEYYFGSSAFGDLIHNMQLKITGADVSFNAPLRFNATIKKGIVTMCDMFNLYKYENKLYVVRMKGEEIRNHLEMSYSLWTNQMKTSDDHILLFNDNPNNTRGMGLKNPMFNFDSAAGIDYEVDVTKPRGQKIRILRMSNGKPFDPNAWYKVAMNSYRGNGGGALITEGAGIPKDSIDSRIIFRTDTDQRLCLINELKKMKHISPKANNNWRFVPEDIVTPAIERDRKILFGK